MQLMTHVHRVETARMCTNIIAIVRTVEQYFITVLVVTILVVSPQSVKPDFTSRDITVTSSRSSNDVTKSSRTASNQQLTDELSVQLTTTTTTTTLLTALDSNQRRKMNTSRTWNKAAVTAVIGGVVTDRPIHSNISQQQQQQQHHRQHHSPQQQLQQQRSEVQSQAAGKQQQQQQDNSKKVSLYDYNDELYDADDKSTRFDDYNDNEDYNYNTPDGDHYSNEEMLNYDYSHPAFNYSIDSEDLFSRLMPSNGRSRPEPINMSLLVIYSWLGLVVIMVIITVIILKFKPQLNSGCQRASDIMLCRKRRVPGVEEGNTLLTHPLV